MTVVATAGHVDHGKSTLVRALTGTDPDRFAEEKARGLTIDIGFAFTTLPSGAEISFVDVPGHVRYLDNMLAGVGAVRSCLFVVDASEGWKPQSEEHLSILELLGFTHGVVALTKCAVVDDDTRELATLEVDERFSASALSGTPVVPVDSVSGEGLGPLRTALDALVQRAPAAPDVGRPRLWVDRSFAAKGAGAVVTGTLTGGALATGDTVNITPAGSAGRVRGLQRHGASVERIGAGNRVAVNLAGLDHKTIERGDALVNAAQWSPSTRFDATMHVLPTLDHKVSRRGAYRLHIGAGAWPVRVRVLGANALAPGDSGAVRVHLPAALPLVPGDRFVLRESGRAETVGGGEVLDVAPVLPASRARPDRSVDRVVAERGWIDVNELERITGERRKPTTGSWVVAPTVVESIRATGAFAVGPGYAKRPPTEVVAAFAPRQTEDDIGGHRYLDALRSAPFTPPPPDGVDTKVLRRLREALLAVDRDGIWFAVDAIDAAARVVARLLTENPEGVTVAQVRLALNTTRKFVVPLLNHLDATGVTRRRGDVRLGGARLPSLD